MDNLIYLSFISFLCLLPLLARCHPGDGGGSDGGDGLPPCEDGEPACICKVRQQKHCYDHVAESFERDLKKCHVHEDFCAKKGRKKRSVGLGDLLAAGAHGRSKRDDATWKDHQGYKDGVKRMQQAMKEAQYCAQDAIHTATEECGLHGGGDPEKDMWEKIEADYGCDKKIMTKCIKARVPEKGSEFFDELKKCKEVYPKSCDDEIARLQCECIQKAKPIIDLKCKGEVVSFFLGPANC